MWPLLKSLWLRTSSTTPWSLLTSAVSSRGCSGFAALAQLGDDQEHQQEHQHPLST